MVVRVVVLVRVAQQLPQQQQPTAQVVVAVVALAQRQRVTVARVVVGYW